MSLSISDSDSLLAQGVLPREAGILVVDEDPAFQLGLKTFLKEYVGFENVFVAADRREALELIEREDAIEVVTLDHEMPGGSGIDVMEALSPEPPRPLTVLMLTGHPSDELEARFCEFDSPTLHARHFLTKPIEFEKLEPRLLSAYEDLKNTPPPAPPEAVVEEPEEGAEEVAPTSIGGTDELQLDQVEQRLHINTSNLESLEEEVKRLRGKWRRDIFLLILLGLGLWVAGQFGLWAWLSPKWDNFRDGVKAKAVEFEAAFEAKRAAAGAEQEDSEISEEVSENADGAVTNDTVEESSTPAPSEAGSTSEAAESSESVAEPEPASPPEPAAPEQSEGESRSPGRVL
ncbi:MAG: response regulator [Verrucomicrobiota bacterium]